MTQGLALRCVKVVTSENIELPANFFTIRRVNASQGNARIGFKSILALRQASTRGRRIATRRLASYCEPALSCKGFVCVRRVSYPYLTVLEIMVCVCFDVIKAFYIIIIPTIICHDVIIIA